MDTPKIIDLHCHMLAFGSNAGGFVQPDFMQGIKARAYLSSLGLINRAQLLGTEPLPEHDSLYETFLANLLANINESKATHAVVLAMDGLYDHAGRLDRSRTQWMVTNEAVVEYAARSPKILPGASINPLRRDWEDELEKCAANGCVLIKWLPCTQGFDPSDRQLARFYQRTIDLGLPILTHVGFEYAVGVVDINLSSLEKLELPLSLGATIIAAHGGGGRPLVDSASDYRKLGKMIDRFPNLFLDISAMTTVHRKSRFKRILKDGRCRQRIVNGTDFPIPVMPWAFKKELRKAGSPELPRNPFDLDLIVKRAMGVTDQEFARGYDLLRIQNKS